VPGRRFFDDVPKDHRSDWGEALANALGAELERLSPTGVTTSARSGRAGLLDLHIAGPGAQKIEIRCLEDEATVSHRGERRDFSTSTGVARWRPDPGRDWIPDAVDHVIGIIRGWSEEPPSAEVT
jgi:hypothetical protein